MQKRIFKQKGGILPMLLPFVAKAAAPLAGSLLSGRVGKLFYIMVFKKSILISNDISKKVKNNNNFSLNKKNSKKKKEIIITHTHQKAKVTRRTKA